MSAETIFVSYSSKDRPFAIGLVKELQSLGVNVWIDQLGIGLGENWDDAIEEALEKSETLMLILSPTSVESPNVQDEVSIAINTKKKMVPILIEECKLPMRWQRRQYADLTNNPDKAIHDILSFLGLKEKASANLKKVLKLIGVSEAPKKVIANTTEESTGKAIQTEVHLEDLLVSEDEINRASKMHEKGIKKNWKMIIVVGVLSLVTFGVLGFTNLITVPFWIAAVGSLALNLLSINPFGAIKKRERNIDLLELLKLKRERLTRVMNKLSDTEIEKFNTEFYNYIKI
ncbi:toll/interleukin-1 receptor domain-containing protein [Hwangdonia lutea]|uniref:Toll/interleukin-1 receptor domain-containing protein n=1 Tax=Hwangdonia lutea TaxID=3075823 RepID=A0AA97EPG0_9FLAO|nr:toll/interleukin-1 receptor domain-containing protein [Hwangdonia sp. SCSIO 19198]WOD43825.1 toll/interleukin-1 receptor domain-containing protein [Hwangdonia sp. SCSIO 19198]